MMRKFTFLQLLAMVLLLANCDSKNSEGEGGDASLKTPEENKEAIQDIAIQFVQEISELEATPSVQAAISLGFALEESDSDKRLGTIAKINKGVIAFSKGKLSGSGFAESGHRVNEDEPFTLADLFDENKGTYDWNSETEDWDITEGGSVVEINFPSEDGGATNDASLTLRSYTGTTIASPIDEEYEGDLPTSLLIDLYIDDVKEMEYSFNINYNSNGEPEKIDTELFMNPFSLSVGLTNTTSKVAHSVSFTHDSKTLIGVDVAMTGNFSEESITDAEDDANAIKDVINSASFSYQMLNLKLAGELDVPSFYDDVKDIALYRDDCCSGGGLSASDIDAVEDGAVALEAALNAHGGITMTYADTGNKAADIEWKTDTETWEDSWYSEIWVTIGANMVFADESKVDVEDYLTTGFDQLEAELNKLLDQFGNSVDEDLGDIDFDDIDFD